MPDTKIRGSLLEYLARLLRDLLRRLRCLFQPCPPTTVAILRHADVARPRVTDDDPLNDDGRARADVLVHVLGDAGVDVIYASEFQRTQLTAALLATHLGLTTQVRSTIQPAEVAGLAELAAEIRANHTGGTAVVVGHSITPPALISALGAHWEGVITDPEFDNLLWVTLPGGAANRVHHLHYGARTSPEP